MRTVRAIGVGLAMLAGWLGSARAQTGAINFLELFQQLDANGDQVIEKSEVPESGRAAFERLLRIADTNKDGKIDGPEYREMLTDLRRAGPGGGGDFGAQIAAMDKDGDGKVSRSEYLGPPPLFERLDADKDGALSKDEVARMAVLFNGTPAERFRAMDRDGDGKVGRDEFLGPPARFDQIDADKDGSLSLEELREAQPAAGKAATKAARKKAATKPRNGE
jgi:Ca2+-binding EF-hand superfamily protein